jgi:signal transduction histidine kinase
VVEVGDTGLGIPASDQADLCTRFFRASNAVDGSVPGAGPGRPIAATIIGNHGGEIALESQEGRKGDHGHDSAATAGRPGGRLPFFLHRVTLIWLKVTAERLHLAGPAWPARVGGGGGYPK